jgi:zinc protease
VTVQKCRLDNGLTLLCESAHDAPVVALQAWVRAGAADETDDIAGIAHVHEHMLFKGTRSRPVGEIARQIEASGGEINAWTAHDQTVYHVVLESSQWRLGLEVLADALKNPLFEREELERELEVVVEEIRRSEDIPARRASHALFALAYKTHPYGRPVLGFEKTVRALTREQILCFFHEHYRPERTTFIVAGDVSFAEVAQAAADTLDDWKPQSARRAENRPAEPSASAPAALVLHEEVKEARLALAWHIPAMADADTAALDALAVVLGHGDASRLYEKTRREQKLVNDIYAYAYTPAEPGLLTIGATLPAKNAGSALDSILAQTYALRFSPVSQDELDRAKTTLLSEAAYQRETVQGLARRLGFFEVVCGDYQEEQSYNQRIRALTPSDLVRAARRYVSAAASIIVQLPTEAEPPAAEAVITQAQQAFDRHSSRDVKTRRKDSAGVELFTLDSGTRVILRPEQCPIVALRALCLGGQRWEKKAEQGLSSLFSSVWGLASEKLSTTALAQTVAELGGSVSAFSGRNTLGLRAEFLADNARRGLEVFLDLLARPAWDPLDFQREKHVALERVSNREDHPHVVAFDAFAEAVFPCHPYGLRLYGTRETLEPLGVGDLVRTYERFVAGRDRVIAITGGFAAQEAVDVLGEHLTVHRQKDLGELPPRDLPPQQARRTRLTLGKQQSQVIVGSMGVTLDHADRAALEVLTTILSGQGGRLFADLRDKRSLAYAVSAASVEGLDPGHVLVYLATTPDKVDAALLRIYEHLDRLCQEYPGSDELRRAQRYLIGARAIDLQRTSARAMTMALDECCGLGYGYLRGYADRVRSVATGDVQRVAQRYLSAERLVEVVVGPSSE